MGVTKLQDLESVCVGQVQSFLHVKYKVAELGRPVRHYDDCLLIDGPVLQRFKLIIRNNLCNFIKTTFTVRKSAVKQDLFVNLDKGLIELDKKL